MGAVVYLVRYSVGRATSAQLKHFPAAGMRDGGESAVSETREILLLLLVAITQQDQWDEQTAAAAARGNEKKKKKCYKRSAPTTGRQHLDMLDIFDGYSSSRHVTPPPFDLES